MKALFISNDPTIFIVDSAARKRMREYAAAIGELHIASVGPAGAKEEQEGTLFLHPVPSGWFRFSALTRVAKRLVREKGIEVVSAQDPFEHGRIARTAVAGSKARLHIQIHTDFLSPNFSAASFKNRMRVRIADHVIPEADGIRTVSKRIRDSVLLRYEGRIVDPSIVPIAPPPLTAAPIPLPASPFTFSLLMSGRLEREKRIEDAFAALALTRTKYPGTGLFIAGSGREESRLRADARARGVGDAVVFLGEQGEAAQGLMRSAHAYLSTSAYEGYGRTFIEAALARLPIVATETGIIGDVLLSEREVLACPVGDVACIASQIGRLVEDNQLRRALAVNAEAAALAHLAHFQNLPQVIADDLARRPAPVRNQGATR